MNGPNDQCLQTPFAVISAVLLLCAAIDEDVMSNCHYAPGASKGLINFTLEHIIGRNETKGQTTTSIVAKHCFVVC